MTVNTECTAGHNFKWESHPKVGRLFAGNLLIPAAAFLAGKSYYNFLEMCKIVNLKALSQRGNITIFKPHNMSFLK